MSSMEASSADPQQRMLRNTGSMVLSLMESEQSHPTTTADTTRAISSGQDIWQQKRGVSSPLELQPPLKR